MNPKINKLKAEREKNSKKIAALQQRNREIDDSIHELENLDIVGMVRSCGMTPEQLAVLIRASKGATLPPLPAQLTETEESEYAEQCCVVCRCRSRAVRNAAAGSDSRRAGLQQQKGQRPPCADPNRKRHKSRVSGFAAWRARSFSACGQAASLRSQRRTSVF